MADSFPSYIYLLPKNDDFISFLIAFGIVLLILLIIFLFTKFKKPLQSNDSIPEEEKSFAYWDGDILLTHDKDGFSIIKILKIEQSRVEAGGSINVSGHKVTFPRDDHFLIIHGSLGKSYSSEEKALKAYSEGSWLSTAHAPMRPSGITPYIIRKIDTAKVSSDELQYIPEWREKFVKGETGVF